MSLKQHIENDPDNRGYAGMTAEQVVSDLKVKRHPSDKRLGVIGLVSEAGKDTASALLSALDAASGSDVVVSKVLKILENGGDLNINDQQTRNFINDFVTNSLLTQEQADSILVLADNQLSDEEKYQLGFVKVGHVLAARS